MRERPFAALAATAFLISLAATFATDTASGATSFSPPAVVEELELFERPASLASGDFDRDGHADLAVGVPLGVRLAYGVGDGTFVRRETIAGGGDFWTTVAAADFDGVNGPDLVLVGGGYGEAEVLLNDGQGGFARGVRHEFAAVNRGEVAVGDITGDGDLDLVVAGGADTVAVLPGDGTGDLGEPAYHQVGGWPRAIDLADLDGDSRLDLVTTNVLADHLTVLYGMPGGDLGSRIDLPVNSNLADVAVVDPGGDGHLDIVAADESWSRLVILRGAGSRTFDEAEDLETTSTPLAIHTAELNGEPGADLLVGTYDGVDVLTSDGTGALGLVDSLITDGATQGVIGADFDEDGEHDLVVSAADVGIALGRSLGVSPHALDFEPLAPGAQSPVRAVEVRSSGTRGTVDVGEVGITGAGGVPFAIADDGCTGLELDPGETCTVGLRYAPLQPGEWQASLVLESDALDAPLSVGLTGVAGDAEFSFDPFGVADFGERDVGHGIEAEIYVDNLGVIAGHVSSVSLSGSSAFTIVQDGCTNATVEPDDWCVLLVRFVPTQAGGHAATLSVTSDADDSPHVLALAGTGAAAVLPPLSGDSFTWTPTALDFGTVAVGGRTPGPLRGGLRVEVTRVNNRVAVSSRIEGPDAAVFTDRMLCPPAASTCSATVRFTPARAGVHHATLVLQSGAFSASVPIIGTGVGSLTPAPPPLPTRPTRAQTLRILSKALAGPTARWRELGRKRVRKAGVVAMTLPAMAQGGSFRLVLRAAGKRKRLVAVGDATTEAKRVWASLTRPGKALLGVTGKRRLRVILSFDPASGRTLRVARSFTLPG